MKAKHFLILLWFLGNFVSLAQDSLLVGKKYFEDQLYTGININLFHHKPEGVQPKGISAGFVLGFIKDISLNSEGSLALGIGAGYAYNKYIQNIRIHESSPHFEIIEGGYLNNFFVTHSVEFPLELRFRITSTPTVYKFWRVYVGAKLGYVFASKSSFIDEDYKKYTSKTPFVNKWQYGPQIALGYHSLNFYLYYNVPGIFNKGLSDATTVQDLKKINIGLQFYIF